MYLSSNVSIMNTILKLCFFVAVAPAVYGGVIPSRKLSRIHPFLASVPLPRNFIAKSPLESCDEDHFAFCTQNLAKAFNLTAMPTDAEQFLNDIQNLSMGGVAGFESLCKITDEFVACLGDSYSACVAVANLIHEGLDQNDATIYATIAAELRYECGPAYEVIIDHFDCATLDSKAKIDQIYYCITQFNNSIYSDPAKICQEVQTFNNCYEDVYSNCGADFDDVICGVLQAAYSVSLPSCTITCVQESVPKLNIILKTKKN